MKILFIIHHELDPNAGAAGATLKLGQEYEKLGYQVQYYSFDHLPDRLSELTKSIVFPEFVAAHIAKLCRDQAIDVVNASTGDAWVWGRMLRRFTGKHQPLLVTQSHGLEHVAHLECLAEARQGNLPLSWKYPLYHGGFRLWEVTASLRCADLVFMLNQRDVEYAIHPLKVAPERIHRLPNGIPDTFLNLPFEPTPEPNAAIYIAQVGSYIARKGIHYGVPALNAILARHPNVKVSFLGTKCAEASVYEDFEPEVRDRIRVISSFSHEDLPILLRGHQILLFPSLSEGFPLAVPEAMACGLAPVSTNIPGPTEMVVDEENALLVPVRDSQAIENALERLIVDRHHLDSLRRNAYATAQQYSWAAIAQRQLSIYQAALERKRVKS